MKNLKTLKIRAKPQSEKSLVCYLCVNDRQALDYRDTALLSHFLSSFMKIMPRRRSGLCTKHQRKVAEAIKRSRQSGLLPYLPR